MQVIGSLNPRAKSLIIKDPVTELCVCLKLSQISPNRRISRSADPRKKRVLLGRHCRGLTDTRLS
jgi:hypothetical protein